MRAHHEYDFWNIKTISLPSDDPVEEASSFDPPPASPCDSDPPQDRKFAAKWRGGGGGSNVLTSK